MLPIAVDPLAWRTDLCLLLFVQDEQCKAICDDVRGENIFSPTRHRACSLYAYSISVMAKFNDAEAVS